MIRRSAEALMTCDLLVSEAKYPIRGGARAISGPGVHQLDQEVHQHLTRASPGVDGELAGDVLVTSW